MESNEDIIRSDLGRIISRIPEVEKDFAEEIMEITVEEINKSANNKFNDFNSGQSPRVSMNNVRESQSSEGAKLTLDIKGDTPRDADYLEWHERADEGHYVEVNADNLPIRDWVEKHYDHGEDPDYLFVTPTPFVKPAVQRIARRARRKAEGEDNAIAELGREV